MIRSNVYFGRLSFPSAANPPQDISVLIPRPENTVPVFCDFQGPRWYFVHSDQTQAPPGIIWACYCVTSRVCTQGCRLHRQACFSQSRLQNRHSLAPSSHCIYTKPKLQALTPTNCQLFALSISSIVRLQSHPHELLMHPSAARSRFPNHRS